MSKFVVGVIGVGNMGRNHVRVYSELRGVDGILTYDPDQSVDGLCGSMQVDSLDDVLESCDAVSICTPTADHYGHALAALRHKTPCLVEKPISSSFVSARALASHNDSRLISVGHIERFNPAVLAAADISEKPTFISVRRFNPASSRSPSDVVHDLMIHDIDIVDHLLLDSDLTVAGAIGDRDCCSALVTGGSCVVSLSASRGGSERIRDMYIECPDCSIYCDMITQTVRVARKPTESSVSDARYHQINSVERFVVPPVEPLRAELSSFVDSVRNGSEFPVTVDQAVENMRICSEIHDS